MRLDRSQTRNMLYGFVLITSLAGVLACGSDGSPSERKVREILNEHLAQDRKSYECVDLRATGSTPHSVETLLELAWIRASESDPSFEILDAGHSQVIPGRCTPDGAQHASLRFHPNRGATPRETPKEWTRFRVRRVVVDSILSIGEPIDGRFGRTILVEFDTDTTEITEFGRALGYGEPPANEWMIGRSQGLAERIALRLEEGEWVVMRSG